jgi:hypothetical protein
MATRWQPAYRPWDPAEAAEIAAAAGLLVVHFWAAWDVRDRLYNSALVAVRERFGGRAVFRSRDVDEPPLVLIGERWEATIVPTVAASSGTGFAGSVEGKCPAAELVTRVGAWVRRARRVIDPRWRTEDVLGLARGIAADGALERLPILADALMEAGCDDEDVLGPCRRPKGGWWVVDLLLGRG